MSSDRRRPEWVCGRQALVGRIGAIADEVGARGLVCFGYPFHPPGDKARLRTKHLETLRAPALILQGERDAFGDRGDVEGYALSPAIRIRWIAAGDHSFKPPAKSGRTEPATWRGDRAAAEFIESLLAPHAVILRSGPVQLRAPACVRRPERPR